MLTHPHAHLLWIMEMPGRTIVLGAGYRYGFNGKEKDYTVFTSPDNSRTKKESLKAHGQVAWNNAAFFTGSFHFKISGNQVLLQVHNEFSISSGVTRNKADDLHRQTGAGIQLGNTTQWFEFTIDVDKMKKQ